MLRAVTYALRMLIVLVVGGVAVAAGPLGPAALALEITALVTATVVIVVWMPTDRLATPDRGARLRPYALAAMMATCAVASATPKGGAFNLLVTLAAISAGSDLDLGAGIAVGVLGIVATAATSVALGAAAAVTFLYPLVVAFGFVLGRNMRAHRSSAMQANQLREEQARAAALDERARIAREIHDVLAHSLGALGLQIQVARAVLSDQHDEARALEVLEQAQRMATDGMDETRRAIHALRGETLPLPDRLAELRATHQRRHGTPVTLEISGAERPIGADAQVAITRTTEEALVNTAKHAPHQPVEVHLDYADGDVSLTVRNHLDAAEGPRHGAQLATVNGGYGLAGMRERLLLLDGTLRAGPQGDDWLVVATVPQ